MRTALRQRRQMRLIIRLTGVGAIAACLAMVVFLDMGFWSTNGHTDQAASLEQLVQQFITAADSCQLAGITSEIDQQISDLEDQVTQYQSLYTGSMGLDGQINQLEDDLADLADCLTLVGDDEMPATEGAP